MVITLEKARFLVNMILRSIVIEGRGFNSAYRALVRRYGFGEHEAEQYYKFLYNVVTYYSTLKFIARYYGFKSNIQGIIEYLYRKNFTWRLIKEDIEDVARNFSKFMRISLLYSYPSWFVKDLSGKLSLTDLEAMLKSLNEKKRWLRVVTSKCTPKEAISCLEKTGLNVEPHKIFHEVLLLKNPFKKIGNNPCVLNGIVIPQDISSYIVGLIAQNTASENFLDACCAPGLKLMQVLSSSKVKRVVAVDLSEKRIRVAVKILNLLTNRADPRVIILGGDSRRVIYSGKFDFALLDAPCSNSGALYDDPALKIRLSKKLIKRTQRIQYSLLSSIIKQSRLVLYATCTVHPLEGEEVIEKLVKEHDVELVKVKYPYLESAYAKYTVSQSTYRIYPHRIQGQGFFVALIAPRQ